MAVYPVDSIIHPLNKLARAILVFKLSTGNLVILFKKIAQYIFFFPFESFVSELQNIA